MERDYRLARRRYVIGGAVLVVVALFIVRLFMLQIMSDDYKKNADSNAFLQKIQYPSRGVIYDRTGKLLVYNQPAYDITVVMKEITQLDTLDLCNKLKITPEIVRKSFSDLKDQPGVLDPVVGRGLRYFSGEDVQIPRFLYTAPYHPSV